MPSTAPRLETRQLQRTAADALSPAIIEQLEAVELALGGRDQVIATLACAPRSEALDYLLGLIADPAHEDLALADLCAAADLRPAELFKHLHAGNLNKAQALTSPVYPQHLRAVVEDLFLRAQPHTIPCEVCQGAKPAVTDCPACQGKGAHTRPGDLARAQVVLKMAGLLGGEGSGGSAVNNQVNILAGGGQARSGAGGSLIQSVAAVAAATAREFDALPLAETARPSAPAAPVDGEVVDDQ